MKLFIMSTNVIKFETFSKYKLQPQSQMKRAKNNTHARKIGLFDLIGNVFFVVNFIKLF